MTDQQLLADLADQHRGVRHRDIMAVELPPDGAIGDRFDELALVTEHDGAFDGNGFDCQAGEPKPFLKGVGMQRERGGVGPAVRQFPFPEVAVLDVTQEGGRFAEAETGALEVFPREDRAAFA